MPRLPRLTAKKIITVLEKNDFAVSRQAGSHRIYKNSIGKRVTVPVHGGKTLHPKVLKSILRDAEISVEKLEELLK